MKTAKENNMKTNFFFCSVLSTSILISGCAATDRQATEGEATATGALVGALIGGIIGDSKKGVAIGAAVGAIAGSVYGKHVADKKEEYASNEDYMNAVIAEADKVVKAAKEHRATLEAVIAERQVELARLNDKSLNAQEENEELKARLAQVKEQTEKLKNIISQEIKIQEQTLEQERAVIPASLVIESASTIDNLKSEQKLLQTLEADLMSLDEMRVY